MRVLGIDCGTECTGYGVVEMDDCDRLSCLGFGGITLTASDPLPKIYSFVSYRVRGLHSSASTTHTAMTRAVTGVAEEVKVWRWIH